MRLLERGRGNSPWGWFAEVNTSNVANETAGESLESHGPFPHPVAAALKAHGLLAAKARSSSSGANSASSTSVSLFDARTGAPNQQALGSWAYGMGTGQDVHCYSSTRRKWATAYHHLEGYVAEPQVSSASSSPASTNQEGASTNVADSSTSAAAGGPSYWRLYARDDLTELFGLTLGEVPLLAKGKDLRLAPWLEQALGPYHAKAGVEAARAPPRGSAAAAATGSTFGRKRPYLDLSAGAVLFLYCGLPALLTRTVASGDAVMGPVTSSASFASSGNIKIGSEVYFAASAEQLAVVGERVTALLGNPTNSAAAAHVDALLSERLKLVSRAPGPSPLRVAAAVAAGSSGGSSSSKVGDDLAAAALAAAAEEYNSRATTAKNTSTMNWEANVAFKAVASLDGVNVPLKVARGDDMHTVAARFCRRWGVKGTDGSSGGSGASACWKLVPWLQTKRDAAEAEFRATSVAAGVGSSAAAGAQEESARGKRRESPIATLASPSKGAQMIGPNQSVTVAIQLSKDGAPTAGAAASGASAGSQGGFCCVYANDETQSSWCGEVPSAAAAAAGSSEVTTVGSLSQAALGGGAGPHLLHLICRRSRSVLEADLMSTEYLQPDDASFFAFKPLL